MRKVCEGCLKVNYFFWRSLFGGLSFESIFAYSVVVSRLFGVLIRLFGVLIRLFGLIFAYSAGLTFAYSAQETTFAYSAHLQ